MYTDIKTAKQNFKRSLREVEQFMKEWHDLKQEIFDDPVKLSLNPPTPELERDFFRFYNKFEKEKEKLELYNCIFEKVYEN